MMPRTRSSQHKADAALCAVRRAGLARQRADAAAPAAEAARPAGRWPAARAHWSVLLVLCSICLASKAALAGTISADLDHTEGAVGEPFVLTVTIEGAREGEPEVPSVEGLEIHQQGGF